jgi:hypothetical protein
MPRVFVTIDALDRDRRDYLARGVSKFVLQARVPGVRDPCADAFAVLLASAEDGHPALLPWGVAELSANPVGGLIGKLWKRFAPADALHVALVFPCDPDEAFDSAISGGRDLDLTLEDFRRAADACRDLDAFEASARAVFDTDLRVHVVHDVVDACRVIDDVVRA